MGWIEAVVTVLTSLIWPAVVVFAVLILRKELAGLVARLSRLTAPGIEAEFGAEVAATAAIAEAVVPDPAGELRERPEPLAPQPTFKDLQKEAVLHPVGAIVRAWGVVLSVLPSASIGVVSTNPAITFKALYEAGTISDEMFAVSNRLRMLRNQVVHGGTIPSAAEAEEFVSAAWRLASSISWGLNYPG